MERGKTMKMVRIKDEDYEVLKMIKTKEERTFVIVLSKAINYYAKVKRLTPWDKLPKKRQESMIKKAQDLVKAKS